MKKIILFVLLNICTLLFAVAQSGTLKIKGEVANLEKGSVEVYLSSNVETPAASGEVQSGKFMLSCSIDLPQQVYLYVKDTADELIYITRLFSGAGEITVKEDKEKDKALIVLNAPLNDELRLYYEYIRALPEYKQNGTLSRQVSAAFNTGDKMKVNEISVQKDRVIKQIIDSIFAWKENAAENLAAAYHICEYASSLPLADQIEISKRFPKNMIAKSYHVKELLADIESERKVEVGCLAPDFKVKDLEGAEYSLASFKGKYIYLEFSASWCGWCKKEIPFIRTAYHALKDKNIVFVTMNMDTTREKWEGDVTKENIEWMCLSNLEGMKSSLAQAYNIHGIPACFVIDPTGKIIKKDIRGNEVIEYLSGLF